MTEAAFFDHNFDSDTVPSLLGAFPLVVALVESSGPVEAAVETLESLRRTRYANLEIFLVSDDGVGDEPAPILQRFAEITLVRVEPRERGVAARNAGLRHALAARGDYVLLLTADAEVEPSMLAELVDAAEGNASVGCVGPMAYCDSDRERPWPEGEALGFPRQPNGGAPGEAAAEPAIDREWLDGCGLLMKRSVIEQVGLFDPSCGAARADLDWCLRARRKGFRCRQVQRARLWRRVLAQSNGAGALEDAYERGRDAALLARRHARGLDWARFWLALMGSVPGTYLADVVEGDSGRARATWRGIVDGLAASVAPPPGVSGSATRPV